MIYIYIKKILKVVVYVLLVLFMVIQFFELELQPKSGDIFYAAIFCTLFKYSSI